MWAALPAGQREGRGGFGEEVGFAHAGMRERAGAWKNPNGGSQPDQQGPGWEHHPVPGIRTQVMGSQRRWLVRGESQDRSWPWAAGLPLALPASPASASSSKGPSQPLAGESRVWASPLPARDLSQEPSAARKGAMCGPARNSGRGMWPN